MSDEREQIRILAIDDHALVREGVAVLVATQADMALVGEASDGAEGIQRFRELHPDVTIMDLQMPGMNGLDALIAIRNEFPEARVIVLTTYGGDIQILRALKAGAQAYLLKTSLHKELLETIRGSCGKEESVATGLVRDSRACDGRRPDACGNRRVATDRGRECKQANRGPAFRYGRNG